VEWEGSPRFPARILRKFLKLISLRLRDSHANILEQAISGICSLVHTFADFLRIDLGVLRYQPENGGE
jgi:hypothetical protein